MGSLQTFFYLALISAVMIGLTLLLIGIVAFGLLRWFRQTRGQTPLTFWLISGAVTVVVMLATFSTLVGSIRTAPRIFFAMADDGLAAALQIDIVLRSPFA